METIKKQRAKQFKNKKNRNWIKNLNSKQTINQIPVSLTQIKAGNNLYQLKNEIR